MGTRAQIIQEHSRIWHSILRIVAGSTLKEIPGKIGCARRRQIIWRCRTQTEALSDDEKRPVSRFQFHSKGPHIGRQDSWDRGPSTKPLVWWVKEFLTHHTSACRKVSATCRPCRYRHRYQIRRE